MSESIPTPPPIGTGGPEWSFGPSADSADAPKNVGFAKAISRAFRHFAKFSGRASRSEYWWFMLLFIPGSIYTCGSGFIVLLIPALAITSRRIHDTGRSAVLYFCGLGLMPIISAIVSFYFLVAADGMSGRTLTTWQLSGLLLSMVAFGAYWLSLTLRPGTIGPNKFGPGPQ